MMTHDAATNAEHQRTVKSHQSFKSLLITTLNKSLQQFPIAGDNFSRRAVRLGTLVLNRIHQTGAPSITDWAIIAALPLLPFAKTTRPGYGNV
jgi:hypothetical protein